MNDRLFIAEIIESAIGMIAAELIDDAEEHTIVVFDEPGLRLALKRLATAIAQAEDDRLANPDFIRNMKIIIKSLPVAQTTDLVVYVARMRPGVWDAITGDELIAARINHIKRVSAVARIFCQENVSALTKGIDAARRRVFDISHQEGDQ